MNSLRLTPFEEYMLVDDQPAYPMDCFFLIKLQGQFDMQIFESALRHVLSLHPFLTSCVTEQSGRFYWQHTGQVFEIIRGVLDAGRHYPVSRGINLLKEPALKIYVLCEPASIGDIRWNGETHLVFEVHHSASDAAGLQRFIEDIICRYAYQAAGTTETREPVLPDELIRRGNFGPPRNHILKTLPKQLWGLQRAWTFLLNRVMPLTLKKPAEQFQPAKNYPAILVHNFSVTETKTVLQKAKRLGITINDLFLGASFLAMQHWQSDQTIAKNVNIPLYGNLRIAVPTNLRTLADVKMPAANIVSMVFLDRLPKRIRNMDSFYLGIHREMQHIKRCDLGWAFIHGLTLYRRILGSFRNMVKQDRCWSSATVSNLGKLFSEVPLPIRDGKIQITDALELSGVESSPPVRYRTALGVCIMTYAGCMTLNLHYDINVLAETDAQFILRALKTEVLIS